MTPRIILNVVLRKISSIYYTVVGVDVASRSKLYPRKDLEKIGSNYGGWVIPTQLINSNSICYCIGCGEDISFDLGLIKTFNCDVYAYDPTPKSIEYVKKKVANYPKFHFFELGLWNKDDTLRFYTPEDKEHISHSLVNLQETKNYFDVEVRSLKSLMSDNNHTDLDLIKIDIEGAEYIVLESILDDKFYPRVLCVEYHNLSNNFISLLRKSIKNILNNGYALVHVDNKVNYTFVRLED